MLGSEMLDVVAQLKVMNSALDEVIRILRRMEDRLNELPSCTCAEHQEGESWLCTVHGFVVRTLRP